MLRRSEEALDESLAEDALVRRSVRSVERRADGVLPRIVDDCITHLVVCGHDALYFSVPARRRARLRAPPRIRAGVPDAGVLTLERLGGGALACASQQTESELREPDTHTKAPKVPKRRCRYCYRHTSCSATAECKGGTLIGDRAAQPRRSTHAETCRGTTLPTLQRCPLCRKNCSTASCSRWTPSG